MKIRAIITTSKNLITFRANLRADLCLPESDIKNSFVHKKKDVLCYVNFPLLSAATYTVFFWEGSEENGYFYIIEKEEKINSIFLY